MNIYFYESDETQSYSVLICIDEKAGLYVRKTEIILSYGNKKLEKYNNIEKDSMNAKFEGLDVVMKLKISLNPWEGEQSLQSTYLNKMNLLQISLKLWYS